MTSDNDSLRSGMGDRGRNGMYKPNSGGTGESLEMHYMDRLTRAFESSARRWELIVYPSLFAFIILAAYGFYLIFSLAQDVHFLAKTVDRNMGLISYNMAEVSSNLDSLTANVRSMAVGVDVISNKVATLEPILTNMDSMNQAIQTISYSTHNMRQDMSNVNHNLGFMNHNIGRPMSFMNAMMPW